MGLQLPLIPTLRTELGPSVIVCVCFFYFVNMVCVYERSSLSHVKLTSLGHSPIKTHALVHMFTTLPGGPFAAFPLLLLCRHMMNGLTDRPAHGLWHMLTFIVA